MDNTINFGIDLGTTNSAIAKFIKGEVVVYNNPQDYGRATLPSVVGFKKDKIIVGAKAKELLEKDPKSVISAFKRKMGTSESFKIKSIDKSTTPIELSSHVLKELKTFVNGQENLESVVITIPASFDLIQSNATKEAGIQAGFHQVVLLQEPIAASLAYANMKKEKDIQDGQWLVYDLGGGTFDVALIKIKDGEMKVVDHEGDNFLGGRDFDELIVEKLIIPKLNSSYKFSNLENELKSASGKYNATYYVLLRRAEDAKIRLSAVTSAEVVVDGIEDDNGNEIDIEITITRSEFIQLIEAYIDKTIKMINTILTRNSLKSRDLLFTLMVGGSTFIPYVRQRTEELLQIPVNCQIDPTSAIAIGAAYYAATKPKEKKQNIQQIDKKRSLSFKTSYNKASKEKEELFSAKVSGDISDLNYRIIRQGGGFDSGIKKLTERISEDLPLVENAFNFFVLTVYDKLNNIIETDIETIGINSGFSINGQPLPEDICLEIDDLDNPGDTKMELLFQRNSTLPLKRRLTFPLNINLQKGSKEDVIRINVLQGSHLSLPASNKTIGYIEVTGRNISRNVAKGSDIEITVTLSESQDLTVSAYLTMIDQEFKETFNPKTRHTPVDFLKKEVNALSKKLDDEINQATEKEDYEIAGSLSKLKNDMNEIKVESQRLTHDDVTDKKYQLEDKKRKLAQEMDNATKNKKLNTAKDVYKKVKEECDKMIKESGNDHERKIFNDIVSQEKVFLTSNNHIKIKEKIDELRGILAIILFRNPDVLKNDFVWCIQNQHRMNNQDTVKSLIDAGQFAIKSGNWDRLREIIFQLFDLLPQKAREESPMTKMGFGA